MILVPRTIGKEHGGTVASTLPRVNLWSWQSIYKYMYMCVYLLSWYNYLMMTGFVEDESPYSEQGKKGTYYFEFSRPLRTLDRLQQVLFLINRFP